MKAIVCLVLCCLSLSLSQVDDDDRDFRRTKPRHGSPPTLEGGERGQRKRRVEPDPPKRSIKQRLGPKEDDYRKYVIEQVQCTQYHCTVHVCVHKMQIEKIRGTIYVEIHVIFLLHLYYIQCK